MSFSIAGTTYYPKTASEHAQTMLATMNASLSSSGLPTLSPTTSNALWWVLLAFGQSLADKDAELQSASSSFNIANCDDNQIMNLLPIAGTSAIPATYSSVAITVVASSAGSATIPAGAQIRYGSGYFTVQTTTVIPAGATNNSIICIYSISGPVTCSATQLTAFTAPITNVVSVNNPTPATPGRYAETVPEIRTRLTLGGSISTGLVGCIQAIRSLPGITNANIYFNISPTDALVLPGGHSLAARTAYVIIQGYSPVLAQTFFNYMAVATDATGSPVTQTWVTPSSQSLVLNYFNAGTVAVYIRTRVLDTAYLGSGYADLIRNLISTLNSTALIGELVTSQELGALFFGFDQATILGFEVSLNGSSWASYQTIDADKIPVFTATPTYMPIINQSGAPL